MYDRGSQLVKQSDRRLGEERDYWLYTLALALSSSGIFHCYFTSRSDDSDFRGATRRAREHDVITVPFQQVLPFSRKEIPRCSLLKLSLLLSAWAVNDSLSSHANPASCLRNLAARDKLNLSSLVSSLVFEAASRPRNYSDSRSIQIYCSGRTISDFMWIERILKW